MLPKVATHILHHTSRAAAAVQNQTTQTIRNVLQLQSSPGPSTSTGTLSGWNGPSSSSSNWGSNGAGPGGAKYNAGSRFHNGYTGAGRALTQANTVTPHGGTSGQSDDTDEFSSKRVSLHRVKRTGIRTRSHSLSINVQDRREREETLSVLKSVQIHARSRHPFAKATPQHGLVAESIAIPVSRPVIIRRNSTSAPLTSDPFDALPPPVIPSSSSASTLRPTDPAAPQSAIPPLPIENAQHDSTVYESLKAARNSGDATRVAAEVLKFRESTVHLSVPEYNMALEALHYSRRPGEPLTLILETYNDMLKHSMLPNVRTYSLLILALTDRDHETRKVITGLELRGKRRELSGRMESVQHSTDEERIDQLRSENNFGSAISLFEAIISINGNNKIPLALYHNLLRSCSYHSNVDAAIHVFAQLERRTDILPTAAMFGSLISVYTNVGDIQGVREVFDEFKAACQSNRIRWGVQMGSIRAPDSDRTPMSRGAQLAVWNKMIEAYFRCGHPAGALGVLEQMMDSKASGAFGCADVPPPASSTFTQIIAGFCHSGDVQTALTWFERLLAQTDSGQHPYESSSVPSRPDQVAWIVMLDSLAVDGRVDDLNRIFSILLDTASRDGLEVRAVDRVLVFQSNMKYLDTMHSPDEAVQKLDFLMNRVLLSTQYGSVSLHAGGSRNMMEELVGQYLRWRAPEKALVAVERFVESQMTQLQTEEAKGVLTSSQIHNKMKHVRQLVLDTSSQLLVHRETLPFDEVLRLMRVSDHVGLLPTRAVAQSYLHAYALAKKGKEMHTLSMRDWELLAYGATALEPPTENDSTEPPHIADYAFEGTVSLLEDLCRQHVDLDDMNKGILNRVTRVVLSQHNAENVQNLFSRLGPNYARFLKERQSLVAQLDAIEPKPLLDDITLAAQEEKRGPVLVDIYHSRFVDEFFPNNVKVSPLIAYSRFEAGVQAHIYPSPATIGRLIGALGRLGELQKVRNLYDSAQLVLTSFENDKPRQSQAWFHIEDQMIIAHAHAGDLDSAHMHRTRILDQGGAPTADSYGALIECVKDTTDDTTNALALFQESQMQGVMPNIYLYNNIISKLAKARKADFALELFQQMKANRLTPSSITYGTVIAACARVGDGHSAEILFAEMTQQRNFKPRIPPYNTMMQLYAHTKPNRQRVIYYYDSLLKAKIPPSGHTYKLLLDAYGTIEPVDVEAMDGVFKRLEADENVRIQGTHWAALINAWGCVKKDLDKAVSLFESIPSHPSSRPASLPDAVTFEALINVLVTHRRADLIPDYVDRLQLSGIHMTAYIANCLIKGFAIAGDLKQARAIFEQMSDPPAGVAAPNNHVPHEESPSSHIPSTAPVYREPSTWEAMVRAELGNGHRDCAVALLERLQARNFPVAVYNRISGIMLDDSVSTWPCETSSFDSQ